MLYNGIKKLLNYKNVKYEMIAIKQCLSEPKPPDYDDANDHSV